MILKMIVQINSAAENNMDGFLKKVSNELDFKTKDFDFSEGFLE